MNPIRFASSGLFVAVLLLGGCATHIKTDITQNPPPVEKFAAFSHFEMNNVAMVPAYAGDAGHQKVLAKIQANVSLKMDPLLVGWNAAGAAVTPVRTLLIEPEITDMKFVSGSKRFWLGPFPGSSAIILAAKITEKETGKVIATPVFYARAQAMGGTFTIGATDNIMLVRIAGRLTEYLAANYGAAIGGPSGAGSGQ